MNEVKKLVQDIARNGRADHPGTVRQLRLLQTKYPDLTKKQIVIWVREIDVILALVLEGYT
jgi:hypothetical protein